MKIVMNVQANKGYSVDQVKGMPIGELIAALQEQAAAYGEETMIVLHDQGNIYGASFGHVDQWETFAEPETDEECEECGGDLGHHHEDCSQA